MFNPEKVTDQQLAKLALDWWKCLTDSHGLEDLIYHTIDPKFFLISAEKRNKLSIEIHKKVKDYLSQLSDNL